MADIAMLVAEEYERRVKASRSKADGGGGGGGDGDQIIMMIKKKKKIDFNRVAQRINHIWLSEPKTQIGLAASNGFFSA